MATIDTWLEGFMHSPEALWVVLVVSLLLGLRHASDPDHLAAVTTLVASEEHKRIRKATFMGFCWGLGHGTTLVLIGLPLVLLGRYMPEQLQQAAVVAIGGIIVVLAVRLLLKWRRGDYHVHGEDGLHRHLHSHAHSSEHSHPHPERMRTPLSAYGVGVVHGIGGSGGLTLLLLSTIPSASEAVAALLIFAGEPPSRWRYSLQRLATRWPADRSRGTLSGSRPCWVSWQPSSGSGTRQGQWEL